MSRKPKIVATPEPPRSQRLAALAVCVLLLLAVWLVFAQTTNFGFVNYDDEMNLYGNPEILHGLDADGIRWAWTTTHGSQWAPVTWLSYLADYQIHGLRPQGFHVTNVLLHGATTLLLFLVLWRMTGQVWPCAFVAAVFAIHPLHVETVAWLSERKGLLSGLFFVLTLGAYVEYIRRRSMLARCVAYAAMLALFALGLMSKPVLVTLPFVLLLLDYWPLGRMANRHCLCQAVAHREAESVPEPSVRQSLWRLIAEKIPLLLLAVASSAMAPWAQGTAVLSLAKIPMPARIGNALVSYVDYLGETIWPSGLAVFYPHPVNTMPGWKPAVALLVLLGVTAAVLVRWRRNPYLPVGWFWYVGMLVPTIGLVQIGSHAMADRYMYLPQIGLCIALTWGAMDVARAWSRPAWECGALASLLLVVLTACALEQTTYWRNSEVLWRHALNCTARNDVAHCNLADELFRQQRFSDAIPEYEAALKIRPRDAMSCYGLGNALMGLGRSQKSSERYREAAVQYENAVNIRPDYVEAHCNLGKALALLGRLDEAIAQYEAALKLAPDNAAIRHNLDYVLWARRRRRRSDVRRGAGMLHSPERGHRARL